jgi:predicted ATPase
MSMKLQGVVQQMARVNKNLEGMAQDSDSVGRVAKLWRESYQIADKIGNAESDDTKQQQRSSLLLFDRGL